MRTRYLMARDLCVMLQPFLMMSIFRGGPQDLPSSKFFLALVYIASLGHSVLVAVILGRAVLHEVLENFFLFVVGYVVLACLLCWWGYEDRVIQTVIAIVGLVLVVNIALLPMAFGVFEEGSVGYIVVGCTLLVWFLGAISRVLSQALSGPLSLGIACSIIYSLVVAMASVMFDHTLGLISA